MVDRKRARCYPKFRSPPPREIDGTPRPYLLLPTICQVDGILLIWLSKPFAILMYLDALNSNTNDGKEVKYRDCNVYYRQISGMAARTLQLSPYQVQRVIRSPLFAQTLVNCRKTRNHSVLYA